MILICKGNKKNRHQKDIPFFFTSQLFRMSIGGVVDIIKEKSFVRV